MEIPGLVVGLLLVAAGVYIMIKKEALGERLHSYYSRPRREGRLRWLDRRIAIPSRPTTNLMAWALGALGVAMGLAFIIVSLPK